MRGQGYDGEVDSTERKERILIVTGCSWYLYEMEEMHVVFLVIISPSRWYLPERDLQIMILAASISNAFDYHHSRQYLLFSCETISREMAAINFYSV